LPIRKGEKKGVSGGKRGVCPQKNTRSGGEKKKTKKRKVALWKRSAPQEGDTGPQHNDGYEEKRHGVSSRGEEKSQGKKDSLLFRGKGKKKKSDRGGFYQVCLTLHGRRKVQCNHKK